MGVCCGKPTPPPREDLIGTWASSAQALKFSAGVGAYRTSRRYLSSSSPGTQMRLMIAADGKASMVKVEGNWATVWDGALTSWNGDVVERSCCAAPLSIQVESRSYIVVDGCRLQKFSDDVPVVCGCCLIPG